jgi:hypothetical protein
MIDWANLAANALWILGCALALGTLSFASWEASLYKEKITARLRRPALQFALNLAGLLFCLGLAATETRIFVAILWLVLGFLFLAQLVANLIQRKNKPTI